MKNYVIFYDHDCETIRYGNNYVEEGLKIDIKGSNNTVIIHRPNNFSGCRINIRSSNSIVEIGSSARLVTFNIDIKAGDFQVVKIGKDFSCGNMLALMSEPYSRLFIGDDCMLSSDIVFMVGDSHQIYDKSTNSIRNWSSKILIGNHVWIGRSVRLVSGAEIADNSIIAFGSLVTKSFTDSNVSIGGVPAKVLSSDIYWDRASLEVKHKQKMSKYESLGYHLSEAEIKKVLNEEKDFRWKEKVISGILYNKKLIQSQITKLKSTESYKVGDADIVSIICRKYQDLGDFSSIVNEIEKISTVSMTPKLSIIFIRALFHIDRSLEASQYFSRLLLDYNIKDDLQSVIELLNDYPELWQKRLMNDEIVQEYILKNPSLAKKYFYLMLKLGTSYRNKAIESADFYLSKNLDLKFFVDYFDVLIDEKDYSKAKHYIDIFLLENSNSVWLFRKGFYLSGLDSDIDSAQDY